MIISGSATKDGNVYRLTLAYDYPFMVDNLYVSTSGVSIPTDDQSDYGVLGFEEAALKYLTGTARRDVVLNRVFDASNASFGTPRVVGETVDADPDFSKPVIVTSVTPIAEDAGEFFCRAEPHDSMFKILLPYSDIPIRCRHITNSAASLSDLEGYKFEAGTGPSLVYSKPFTAAINISGVSNSVGGLQKLDSYNLGGADEYKILKYGDHAFRSRVSIAMNPPYTGTLNIHEHSKYAHTLDGMSTSSAGPFSRSISVTDAERIYIRYNRFRSFCDFRITDERGVLLVKSSSKISSRLHPEMLVTYKTDSGWAGGVFPMDIDSGMHYLSEPLTSTQDDIKINAIASNGSFNIAGDDYYLIIIRGGQSNPPTEYHQMRETKEFPRIYVRRNLDYHTACRFIFEDQFLHDYFYLTVEGYENSIVQIEGNTP